MCARIFLLSVFSPIVLAASFFIFVVPDRVSQLTCFGYTCDDLYVVGYTCDILEDKMIGCDCSGCECDEIGDDCEDTCFGYNCDYMLET